MSAQNICILSLPLLLTGTVASKRFVTYAGAQAGAGVNTLGVSDYSGVAGERINVITHGTAIVETGGAIAAGAAVESDASGRAVTKASGVTVGRVLPGQAASVAGDFIEILLINN